MSRFFLGGSSQRKNLGSSAHRNRKTKEYEATSNQYQKKEPASNSKPTPNRLTIASKGAVVFIAKITPARHRQPNRLGSITRPNQLGIASAKAFSQELGEGNHLFGFLVTTGIKLIKTRTIRKIKTMKANHLLPT